MSEPEGVCTRARVRVRARARKNAHLDNFKTGGRFGLKLSQMIGYVEGSWSMACAHVHVRAKRAKTRKNAHLDNFKTAGPFGLKLSQMIGDV